VLKAGWRYFVGHHLRELVKAILRRRTAAPLWLVLAEIKGVFVGPFAYFRSRSAGGPKDLSIDSLLEAADIPSQEMYIEAPSDPTSLPRESCVER